MKKKNFFYVMTLFFLSDISFFSAMELNLPAPKNLPADSPKKKSPVPNLPSLPKLPRSPKKKKDTVIPVASTPSGINSNIEGKITPRDYNEISELVKKHRSIKPLSPKEKPRTKSLLKGSHTFAQELAEQLNIEPELLAESILKVHGEQDKLPLKEEKQLYHDMYHNDGQQYQDIVIELLKMIALKDELGQNIPSEKVVDAHVGNLRNTVQQHSETIETHEKTIEQQGYYLFLSKLANGVLSSIVAGVAIWASYAQAHTGGGCLNGTGT